MAVVRLFVLLVGSRTPKTAEASPYQGRKLRYPRALGPYKRRQARSFRARAGYRPSLSVFLFCFVWLATLGVPVVASGTAADTFRRVVEAP